MSHLSRNGVALRADLLQKFDDLIIATRGIRQVRPALNSTGAAL